MVRDLKPPFILKEIEPRCCAQCQYLEGRPYRVLLSYDLPETRIKIAIRKSERRYETKIHYNCRRPDGPQFQKFTHTFFKVCKYFARIEK